MSDLALTICIPAFNDAAELAKTLSSLKQLASLQHQEIGSQLEILISDNASNDDTAALLSAFELSPIRVLKFRQDRNLGFRGNIEFLARQSSGTWILYLSCGDTLLTDFDFENLLRDLKNTVCDTAFYDFEMLDVSSGKSFSGELSGIGFQNMQNTVLYSAAPMPFYRALVLKTIIDTQPPISGDWWPQIEWALAASSKTGMATYLGQGPVTGNRPESGWWTKPFAYTSTIEMAKLLGAWAAKHQAKTKLRADAKNAWRTLPAWVFQTKVVFNNPASGKDFGFLLKHLPNAPFSVLIACVILLLPTKILSMIRQIARSASK